MHLRSLPFALTLLTALAAHPLRADAAGTHDHAGTAGSGNPNIAELRVTPSVIRHDRTEPVALAVRVVGGVPDRMVLAHEGGGETPLKDDGSEGDVTAGDGIYGALVPASRILAGLSEDDIHRKFIGFVDLYLGNTRTMRLNTFVQIWSDQMGTVNTVRFDDTLQYSNYVINIADPTAFASGPNPSDSHRALVRRVYDVFPDAFDFIDIVFDTVYPANRHHITLRTLTAGIGLTPFDAAGQFGSPSRLLGLNIYPINSYFDGADISHSHEIGHQWINFLGHPALGPARAHWPISSLATGTMGFSIPGSGAGGTYQCKLTATPSGVLVAKVDSPRVFTDLDLYLMGMIPASEVATHYVFKDQTAAAKDNGHCASGLLPYSMFDAVSIQDVIASAGPRHPAYPHAQRDFSVAVVVVSPQLLPPEAMAHYHWFAQRAEAREVLSTHAGLVRDEGAPFFVQTGGRGTLTARLRDGAGAGTLVEVHEFHAASLDHYFLTANRADIDLLLQNPNYGWLPTGQTFKAYARHDHPSTARPVCRFYGSMWPGPNSHFYTADAGECSFLRELQAVTPDTEPRWNFEEIAFAIDVPVDQTCPDSAPVPVFRLYNNRFAQNDSNHRYTTDPAIYAQMRTQGWLGEGAVMCAPH